MSENPSKREAPKELRDRLNAWFSYFRLFNLLHYSLGIVAAISGILITAITSSSHPTLVKVLGGFTAVATGLLTFLRPSDAAREYIRAWRVLDAACTRYELLPDYSLQQLLEAEEQGEAILEKSSDESWF